MYMLHHCMPLNVKMPHHSSKIPIFLLTCNMFDAYGGQHMTHEKNKISNGLIALSDAA